ncbi:Toll [Frankliniella occidentalis]|uniref:Toll-like receptor 4 n=1 Tax=Frankliniella occidentalis TaxID=133901 RepID=A0A6J1TSR1_FRAOC|nr:toll-like receptor 4 [Frankliniella occidentalis]KAE8736544.1 Toll [Frankliniella occidentalis]
MWLVLLLGLAAAKHAAPVAGGRDPNVGVEDARWAIVHDPLSGCSCKKAAPEGHVLCFDHVSCTRFPSNVTVRTYFGEAVLQVRATSIARLSVGDLRLLQHLTELAVDNSRAMVRVEPGAFRGMSLLLNLSLSFLPRLRHLEPGALEGLTALRELYLMRNGFLRLGDVTPALAVRTLPSLVVLNLDDNALRAVEAPDFRPMAGTSLEVLSLAECDLGALHPEGLAPLHRLADLNLNDNHLDAGQLAAALDHLGALGVALQKLDLGSMALSLRLRPALRPTSAFNTSGTFGLTAGPDPQSGVTTEDSPSWISTSATTEATEESQSQILDDPTPPTTSQTRPWDQPDGPFHQLLQSIARSEVKELVLHGNEVARLHNGTLPRMPGLQRLDLSHVDLTEGLPGGLSADVVPDLEQLDLGGNRLPGLWPGFLSDRLLVLNMTASAAPYFNLASSAFRNMSRLRSLDLSYNRVFRLTNVTFAGLGSLQVLTLRNSSLFRLDDGLFLPMERLERLDLSGNPFPLYHSLRAELFQGLGGLRVLLLAGCSMRSLAPDAFRHLSSLQQLDLQDNNLLTLDGSSAFRPLRALERLDVSRNRIGPWRSALFDNNEHLREVRVAGNRLTYLTAAMLQEAEGVDLLDLADNTFHCGCDLYQPASARLLTSDTGVVTLTSKLGRYKCLSPDRWWNRTIDEFLQWATAHSACGPVDAAAPLWWVGLLLGLLFLLLLGSAAVTYRLRHHLRYYLDTIAGRRRDSARELAAHANFQYDAFVSYSNEDQAFVHLMVTTLENEAPHFRLCVYERDFTVGAAITEAVLSSVASSRRVVLVVSPAFARSHWCAWEAHIAHHQRLLAEDALLVVRLGAVQDALLTPTLRYLLNTRIYLEWCDTAPADRQRVFWRKLRAALAPPVGSLGLLPVQ